MCHLSDNILFLIFNFNRYDKNTALLNRENFKIYKQVCNKAKSIIGKFMISKQLPGLDEYWNKIPYRYLISNRSLMIRIFITYYPDEYIVEETTLFSRKLNRLDLEDIPDGSCRRKLKWVLERCTTEEIMHVGW